MWGQHRQTECEGPWPRPGTAATLVEVSVNTPHLIDEDTIRMLSNGESAPPWSAATASCTAPEQDHQDVLTHAFSRADSHLLAVDALTGQFVIGGGATLD